MQEYHSSQAHKYSIDCSEVRSDTSFQELHFNYSAPSHKLEKKKTCDLALFEQQSSSRQNQLYNKTPWLGL